MQEFFEYIGLLNKSTGKRRISEYRYAGDVDDNGDFKLSRYVGHIYTADAVVKMNNQNQEEITDMLIKTQQQNMKVIHNLVSQDLGYIFGERESGPNGAKKQFHTKSAAFLRALGNDLGFKEFKVTNNHGGIAVSGEITLMGMWDDGNGLYLQLFQSVTQRQDFLYRKIKHMKDYSGSSNQWLPCDMFKNGDYETLIDIVSALNETRGERRYAA